MKEDVGFTEIAKGTWILSANSGLEHKLTSLHDSPCLYSLIFTPDYATWSS